MHMKQSKHKLCGRHKYVCLARDLNSHPELSAWRSSRLSTRVFVLHQHTKFEVRRPSCSEDMADFRSQYSSGDVDR